MVKWSATIGHVCYFLPFIHTSYGLVIFFTSVFRLLVARGEHLRVIMLSLMDILFVIEHTLLQ